MSAQRAAQLVEAGLWLQMSGDVEGARRLFEQALKLDPHSARARQLLEAAKAPDAGSRMPETVPDLTVLPPAREQAPEDRAQLFEMDWAGATGMAPAGPSPREPRPPSVAPLAAVPPSDPQREGPSTMVMFRDEGEPLPPAVPPDAPVAVDFTDPDEVPEGIPSVPTPTPDEGPAAIRPVQFAEDATSAWDSQSNPGVHLSNVTPELGDVMDMVSHPPVPVHATPVPMTREDLTAAEEHRVKEEVETLVQGARDLLELDDHTGAMELILKAEQLSPLDPAVLELKERSEKTLQAMFESRIGPMTARPRVLLKDDEIIWLNLDHRAGFVLAQIDGTVTFEDLFEVCGMSRLDTARILAQLVDEGVIAATA